MVENDPEPISQRKLSEIRVREVMNKKPRTVKPDTSIDDLLERMMGQIEDCFPVVDSEQKLVGIVTESDLFHVFHPPTPRFTVGGASIRDALKYSANTVDGMMTKRPFFVNPNMTIVEAMNLMAAHKLRHLPVVEDEKLVGLLCLRDIVELYRILR